MYARLRNITSLILYNPIVSTATLAHSKRHLLQISRYNSATSQTYFVFACCGLIPKWQLLLFGLGQPPTHMYDNKNLYVILPESCRFRSYWFCQRTIVILAVKHRASKENSLLLSLPTDWQAYSGPPNGHLLSSTVHFKTTHISATQCTALAPTGSLCLTGGFLKSTMRWCLLSRSRNEPCTVTGRNKLSTQSLTTSIIMGPVVETVPACGNRFGGGLLSE